MGTTLSESAATRIFLAIATLCSIWIVFVNDYSNVEIQSPIKFGGVEIAASIQPGVKPVIQKAPKVKKSDPLPETETDAEPVADLPPSDVKGFIKKFAALAVQEMHDTGIPASISLAQGIVESRAGRSGMALTANNYFGIKCHVRGKCPGGHCVNFPDDVNTDYFIVYQNAYKSWKAHSAFLKQPRYKKCFQQTGYEGWARELKRAGYATDSGYAKKLIGIIERYKLYMLDDK